MSSTATKTRAAGKSTSRAAGKVQSVAAFAAAEIAKRVAAESPFYLSAAKYHAKAKTVFPRPRTEATRKSLTKKIVEEVMSLHDKHILTPRDPRGEACYDFYRMSL